MGPPRECLCLSPSSSSSCSEASTSGANAPLKPADTSLTLSQRILASGTGATCTALFMTPLDVVKIRLQNQAHPVNTGECFIYSNGLMDHVCRACEHPKNKVPCEWYERPGNFTGTLDALGRIPRQEGLRSLWSGLSPTLLMALPTTVFYYSAYDCLLERLRGGLRGWSGRNPLSGHWVDDVVPPVAAGVVARSVAATLVAPLEVVRTKMQSEHMSFKQIGEAVRSAVRSHGFRGLYLGLAPTLLRDVPFSAIYWMGYEVSKSRVLAWRGRSSVDSLTPFLCGAFSGTIAAVLTNPFDVVKTRRQIELGRHVSREDAATVRQRKMTSVIRRLVSEGGLRALWTGLAPRVMKVAPACAIMIGSYEFFKHHFAIKNAGGNE